MKERIGKEEMEREKRKEKEKKEKKEHTGIKSSHICRMSIIFSNKCRQDIVMIPYTVHLSKFKKNIGGKKKENEYKQLGTSP